MKRLPPIPRADAAPNDLFERGHLWIQEKVAGVHLRFQLLESGVIRVGDGNRTYDHDEIPLPYRHAVRHVRENVDRAALRAAVDDVESVVLFGEATVQDAIDYDWNRVPPFLGFDVWSGEDDRLLTPDAVEHIYDRLGLRAVNTFEREVRAVDFDPDAYDVPRSNWYDGPAEGVVVRNKTGDCAKIRHPDFETVEERTPVTPSIEEVARTYATDRRFERLAEQLADDGRPVTVDALLARLFEAVVREERRRLFDGDRDVNVQELRSELAARTQRFVAERS